MSLRTLETLGSLEGRKVVVRCDLNVPLKDGEITDDGRIRASVPTIERLLSAGASVVAISHLGRPDGEPNEKYSLAPVAVRLAELLGQDVDFVDTPAADITSLDGKVTLLQNLRFDPR
jgi:phosphoglycerate kinase